MSYSMLTRGGRRLHVPALPSGRPEAPIRIQVQNLSRSATTVTIKRDGVPVGQLAIAPEGSATWSPAPGAESGRPSAVTLEAGPNEAIAAVVSELGASPQAASPAVVYPALPE